LDCGVAWARASIAVVAVVALGLLVASGGSGTDPRTPPALPGLPAPFLGTAVAGSGGATAAIDAYGDVVDLRPGPAGPALIDNPAARQAAGSVAPDTGIVPLVRIGGTWLPPWRADAVTQRYLPGTNVVRTVARFGRIRVVLTAAAGDELAVSARMTGKPAGRRAGGQVGGRAAAALRFAVEPGLENNCSREGKGQEVVLDCGEGADRALGGHGARAVPEARGAVLRRTRAIELRAVLADRRWLHRSRPLGPGAPAWARSMYRRSLLTLRALTDRRSGAVVAGARDGWAYVWPRDAATAALAYAAAGYGHEACRVAGFLGRLDLGAAARFDGNGAPVPGRAAQGDAAGWVGAATGHGRRILPPIAGPIRRSRVGACARPGPGTRLAWQARADYREGPSGDYLGNAIAAYAPLAPFETPRGLLRVAGDPGSGLDAAAAWAIRPFPRPAFYPAARATLLRLLARGTRFGITPGEGWPGSDPWTAPTAWSAWAFAALSDAEGGAPARARADRRAALRLLADLRRAATPAGALPERVGHATGIPRSTTPLAWSHAFAVLALRQLWPAPADDHEAPRVDPR
jgi:glucoamylase